jgi:transcription antitermination factor NusG
MNTAWYVLQTNRNKERLAQHALGQRAVTTYLPLIVQWPRPSVGSAIAPMFPGYLFVHLSVDDCARTSWTPGVKAFVSFGGGPVPIEPAVIEFLRDREGPDHLIRCGAPLPGDTEVRIVNGPFRGLTAVVQQHLPARERVRVLMQILQRDTAVELPERWVRRV